MKDISNNFMMIDGNMYDKTAKPVNFEFEGEIVIQCPVNTSATHIRIEQKSIHHYGTPHEYFNTREYHFRTQYFSEVRLPLKLFNHIGHVGSDPCSIMEFVFSTVDADGNTCEKIHDFNIAFENTNMKYVTSYSTTSECERGISRVKRMKFNKDFREENHHTLTLNVDVKPVFTDDIFSCLNKRNRATRETASNLRDITMSAGSLGDGKTWKTFMESLNEIDTEINRNGLDYRLPDLQKDLHEFMRKHSTALIVNGTTQKNPIPIIKMKGFGKALDDATEKLDKSFDSVSATADEIYKLSRCGKIYFYPCDCPDTNLRAIRKMVYRNAILGCTDEEYQISLTFFLRECISNPAYSDEKIENLFRAVQSKKTPDRFEECKIILNEMCRREELKND